MAYQHDQAEDVDLRAEIARALDEFQRETEGIVRAVRAIRGPRMYLAGLLQAVDQAVAMARDQRERLERGDDLTGEVSA